MREDLEAARWALLNLEKNTKHQAVGGRGFADHRNISHTTRSTQYPTAFLSDPTRRGERALPH